MVVIDDRPLDCVETRVRVRWNFLLDFLCTGSASRREKDACFAQLAHHYRAPDRYYHNLHHLADMLDWLLRMLILAPRLDVLGLAVFFHDVIYDSQARDNEEQSAAYAAVAMRTLGLPEPMIGEVQRLILLTKQHQTTADDSNGQILLDADLAILGACKARYQVYRQAIRQEYWWVPDAAYRAGRVQALQRFLQRDRIYATESLFHRREQRARRNLEREIRELSA